MILTNLLILGNISIEGTTKERTWLWDIWDDMVLDEATSIIMWYDGDQKQFQMV